MLEHDRWWLFIVCKMQRDPSWLCFVQMLRAIFCQAENWHRIGFSMAQGVKDLLESYTQGGCNHHQLKRTWAELFKRSARISWIPWHGLAWCHRMRQGLCRERPTSCNMQETVHCKQSPRTVPPKNIKLGTGDFKFLTCIDHWQLSWTRQSRYVLQLVNILRRALV